MNWNRSVGVGALCLIVGLALALVGCESDDQAEGSGVIRGTIESFEVAGVYYAPAPDVQMSLVARVLSGFGDVLVPCAYAGQPGIVVYLDGPVSRVGATDEDGSFVFTGLPAGDYELRFEYGGQEVSYRDNSGQTATITVAEDEIVELTNLRISGGKVNVGNVRVIDDEDADVRADRDGIEWAVTGVAQMEIVNYVGGGATVYNGLTRNTRLTLSFRNVGAAPITGIHLDNVEIYWEGYEREVMAAADFGAGGAWDGALDANESVDVTYRLGENSYVPPGPLEPAAGSGPDDPVYVEVVGYFHAVIGVAADGTETEEVTTARSPIGFSTCYLALPPPGDL